MAATDFSRVDRDIRTTPGNTGFFVPEMSASVAAILDSYAPIASDLKQPQQNEINPSGDLLVTQNNKGLSNKHTSLCFIWSQ